MAIFTSQTLQGSKNTASNRVAAGELVALSRGLYSDEVDKSAEEIVRENWKEILGLEFPGAVISYRSGFDARPVNGYLFVSHKRSRPLDLPGLTIVPFPGPEMTSEDSPLGDGVYLSSEQRALIDNLAPSRSRSGRPARTLSRSEIHDRVVELARRPAARTERLIAGAKAYATQIGRPEDAESIQVFFDSARGRRPTVQTDSPLMRRAQTGLSVDEARASLFEGFAVDLSGRLPKVRPAKEARYLPFFEAYFSNFIEGTEFTVEEAKAIALEGESSDRPADAHDITGTYSVVADLDEMRRRATNADQFLHLLRGRHASIMEGRPEMHPGQFKRRANQAGGTRFVEPDLVSETLRVGWEQLVLIDNPFMRAVYTMFLVSEVHPFDDGNGRVARIMMNSELVAADQSRIIIPTILRSEYLSGLVSMTTNARSDGLVSVLDFAQRYTSEVDFSDFDRADQILTATHAYYNSNAADPAGVSIQLPSRLPAGWQYAAPEDKYGVPLQRNSLVDAIELGDGAPGGLTLDTYADLFDDDLDAVPIDSTRPGQAGLRRS